jgi:hypothetical protein
MLDLNQASLPAEPYSKNHNSAVLGTAWRIRRSIKRKRPGMPDGFRRHVGWPNTSLPGSSAPSGLTEDEKVKLAATVIQRAVRNGLTEVQVYRFPNSLRTDKGRAINQQERGWEKTLTGMAQEIYQLWFDHLKSRGYRIRYQIVDFPGGAPGDIGIVIAWGD